MNSKNNGDIIDILFSVVEERKKSKRKGSYTSFLFNKGMNKIAQKVSEETAETIIEAIQGKKKLAVQESCDLLYHLVVMWSKLGIKPQDIWNELDKRMKKPETKRKKT
ncbi:MAG: Phosphoribosyl-ATP pyrophosphatase [Alphaproteobacteria bacterium MarineAlpha6_Bin6]|nr:phosphoribosyl-ATP diphosphatase [Pelagibacteraceae bacterium]PPR31292.1 MAG: Phosphoribosyl-ATP pyrophosphatase [Alphaproteobacteria bacterium MarineAlpha6_Bin6]PPR33798.1 MAG: Phosphoribosyl-ATP pyrophosphatase [Alphaproteobacteria bacterium MarineAlpha6_Bin5]|tara:strand:+ start:1097 stop:1420 length:324 start_codon:yes stop_codon:yes gene_type:complete